MLLGVPLVAQDAPPFRADQVAGLAWRNVGPANMGGRITDIDVPRGRTTTWYIASAGGGLWKTTNAGTTWEPLFQDQSTVSIGDVAVAPSNPDVVWIGSGEENARNSVSYGNGVYKSTNAGRTFRHMGLEDTFQIGHIATHPIDADIVFVAALGQLWGHNPDRGVFRTKDGGNTWQKVLYLDEKTGCIDVRVDPHDPNIVYACMFERMRDGFDGNDPAVRFGENAGFFRSADGGDTWERIDEGLPTCQWGRSGLTVSASKAGALYMIIETERSGWGSGTARSGAPAPSGGAFMGINGRDADERGAQLTRVTPNGPSANAGLEAGDIVLALGDAEIESFHDLTSTVQAAEGGATVTVRYLRDGEEQELELTYGGRQAGQNPGNATPFGGRLNGQQPNIQGQQGEQGHETGGVFRSDDFGESWRRVNSLTDRPFYYSVIAVDPQNDQNVYSCGTPFYASDDGGAEFRQVQGRIHVDFHAVWVSPEDSDHLIVGCDGGIYVTYDRCETWKQIDNFAIGQFYHCDVDSSDPYRIYGGLQDNGSWGGPSRTRYTEGITIDDWVTIYGGDGFRAHPDPDDPNTVYATSQGGAIGRVDMATAGTARVSKPRGTNYNWDTPFFLSPHNSRILYFAGNLASRSLDRGGSSEAISGELGLTERGTATAFAESPRRAGLLWVGTDDGALWRSEDGGHTWTELHEKLIGMPGPRYVSSITPSRFDDDRVYATFDGHRSNDFDLHAYVSEDGGDTWKSLIANLEDAPAHVIAEDPRNENLLFLGTEFACYASLDRGGQWFRLGSNLPTVAVRDFAIQDRDSDLVAATHGRGVWILDIEPLRQLTVEVAEKDVHLFRPEPATLWTMRSRVLLGHDTWIAENPPYGATVYLWSKSAPPDGATVTVHDIAGKLVGTLPVKPEAGVQALQWNARADAPAGRGGGRGGRGGRGRRGPPLGPGNYSVRYEAAGEKLVQPLVLRPDPGGQATPLSNPTSSETPGTGRN